MKVKDNLIKVSTFATVQIVFIIGILAILVFAQKIYSTIDQTVFENPIAVNLEENKANAVLNSITNQLKYELNSTFGWSANDFLFNSYILDNRAYRQFGVYVATKVLFDHFSVEMAKLGSADKENDNLYSARMNYLALSPSKWGYIFIPSAESYYSKSLELADTYLEEVAQDKAVFNARPDDIYSAFELIVSDKLMGYAIGLLQNSNNISFTEVDNNIYEVQGMMLVVRDYFETLYTLYPEVTDKGNEENYKIAMQYLNSICTFDPLLVTKTFNSSEYMISLLIFAKNRIEDIKKSIRI